MHTAGPALIMFAALAAGLAAEERKAAPPAASATSAKPASAKASETSIDAARQQFDLLKSTRDASGETKAGLPRLAAPEFHSVSPGALPTVTKAVKPELETKSANWLVDAMEKGREQGKDRDRKERGRGIDDERREGISRRESQQDSATAESERTADSKPEMAGVNPLAPYLAQWMTPQDYALLGTGIQRTADGGDLLARPNAGGTSALVGSVGGISPAEIAGTALPAKPVINTPPAENPYLQLLNAAPEPAVSSVFPTAGITPAPAPPRPVYSPPAPAAPPPKPNVPDFLKPQTDEKYFKPLKRF